MAEGLAQRISKKIFVSESGCWLWTGAQSSGYGVIRIAGSNKRVHRVVLELIGVEVGEMVVCHRCDVPACCNPAHLFIGTQVRLPKEASMRAVIRELDATKDALKLERAKNDLLDRELCRVKTPSSAQGRALEVPGAVADLYDAMHGDDQERRDGLERARKRLESWGML